MLANSGHEVSTLALGTMTWGSDTDEPEARSQYKAYVDAGGTFIDTADSYAKGVSEELVGQIVSLHLPLLPETKGLFSATLLDTMQAGAYLINTARGGIVDEQALAERLRSGRLGGAALDVFASEPAKDLAHFKDVPNLILTPHIAGVTEESNERVSNMIAREVNVFLENHS